ncbi:MAG TPA: hypothetical protein PLE19_22080 [Planctomycetota bacterium]|nr:hypothetical protein [Planctomycetota bacterium]HRR82367.1 hypothetical protein [Planctomycetota bacterium]HRT95601.1 hypothetical protein [Planctomycetota bacterium]
MRALAALVLLCTPALAAEPVAKPALNADPGGKVGERPYEMVWADRKPEHPETLDFEDLTGWTAVGFLGCTAELVRSREELMYGTYTGKVTYTGKTGASYFELRPPQPVPIAGEPTACQLWVRGNNWGWHPKPQTARTNVYAIVRDAQGEHFAISLGHVNFDYWFLLHAAFVSPTGQLTGRIHKEGQGDGKIDYPLSFVALRVTNCADEKPARLSFDSLQFYRPDYKPLSEPKLPPKDVPWPTTPETITPTPQERVSNKFSQEGPARVFTARGRRDRIRWTYLPKTGTLDDLTVEINGKQFQPCVGGGPVFELGGREWKPGDEGLKQGCVGLEQYGDGTVLVHCSAQVGAEEVAYSYHLRAIGKSLQVTARCSEPKVTAFRIGRTKGTPNADLFTVPYLNIESGPHFIHWDGVFLSALLDWYNSDASTLEAASGNPAPGEYVYNGGSRYLPKTDGARNPLRERLILTVASDFAEVLPNLPHPKNPNAPLATSSIWRNVGEPVPDLLKRLKAHGVERFICPLHEVGWRDAGESFTFRLRCAPRIGDEKMIEYGKWVHSLGYRFGLYANYTDYAPVNEHWREDRVCLDSDGNWRGAWPRCVAPKPTWAWQAEADLAPKIAAKFGATTCYSDVHTAIAPWHRTDYDARVPGAAMFRTIWDCYAHILWNDCKAYGGPVFSEGNMQWMYAGLISGNYGQMGWAGPERWKRPPLVDFDLLKMHPLQCDFGMGSPDMFYPSHGGEWARDRSRTSPWLDRFITSTLAFGHIGFLAMEWGLDGGLKSFYMTNAVQQRYALVPVAEIRYFDGSKLLPTSDAIRTGAYKRGQVYVKYQSGLELWCNLSFEHDWQVKCDGKTWLLPPTGHLAFKKGDILQFSAVVDGHDGQRMDYVESPDYFYVDSRDRFGAMGPLACKGAAALKPVTCAVTSRRFQNLREVGEWWAIPCDKCDDLTIRPTHLGLAADAALAAEAFGLEDKPLGPAEVRVSNLGRTIMPVKDAARYHVRVAGTAHAPVPDDGVRRLVLGLDYPASIVVANLGKAPLRDICVSAERLGSGGGGAEDSCILKNVRTSPILRRGSEGRVEASLHVPADPRPGERLWYRMRVSGRMGDKEAEGLGWFTGIAAKAVDVAARPADPAPSPIGGPQTLLVSLRSNLPTEAPVALTPISPSLILKPRLAELRLRPGEEQRLGFRYVVPATPGVHLCELKVRHGAGSQPTQVERLWLRFARAKATVAELSKLTPSRLGMQFRGKAEEPLAAESGAIFRAAMNAVGGAEKSGFFCHPPYSGGVGCAWGEFEAALPNEPCEFESLVGFTDGSTTADGCVFSLQVRELPAGSKPAGGWVTVGSLQFGELKKWQPFRADLSAFRGKKVALRLVTDVGPAGNSHSDWAAWGEPRVVLGGERLAVEVLDRETAPLK